MTGKGAIDVFFGNPGNLMASPYAFKKYGQSGIEVSELYPISRLESMTCAWFARFTRRVTTIRPPSS
jgi:hypothetical protein